MRYKFLIINYLLLISSFVAQAQEPEYETIFSKKAMRNFSQVRLYGILGGAYIPLQKNDKVYDFISSEVEIGVTFKKKISVGAFFTTIGEVDTDFRPGYVIKPGQSTDISQYGLSLTYIPKPQNALHLYYNLKVGAVEIDELILNKNQYFLSNTESSLLINPNVGTQMNLLSWLTVNVGAGYRWVAPKNALGVDYNKDLSGLMVQVGFKIGNIR